MASLKNEFSHLLKISEIVLPEEPLKHQGMPSHADYFLFTGKTMQPARISHTGPGRFTVTMQEKF